MTYHPGLGDTLESSVPLQCCWPLQKPKAIVDFFIFHFSEMLFHFKMILNATPSQVCVFHCHQSHVSQLTEGGWKSVCCLTDVSVDQARRRWTGTNRQAAVLHWNLLMRGKMFCTVVRKLPAFSSAANSACHSVYRLWFDSRSKRGLATRGGGRLGEQIGTWMWPCLGSRPENLDRGSTPTCLQYQDGDKAKIYAALLGRDRKKMLNFSNLRM